MLEKIDAYHIEGKLTNEDKAELYALAQADKPVNQYNYAAEIEMLWAAVKELQNRAPIVDEEPEEEEAEAKPFTQPTGAHDAY